MDLRQVQTLLIGETQEKLASLAVNIPIPRKAATLRDLSRLFQAVGICRLLVDANVPKFRENLVRSAQARRYYLYRSHVEHALSNRFLGLSKVEAIFDAVVAGDDVLAREIVSLSVEQWHDGWEYQDDFCYYLFVHRLVSMTGFLDSPESTTILERFESALQGQKALRLELCQTLRARDPVAFRSAFEAFLHERRAEFDAKRPTITEYTAEAIFWPRSFVSVEALAWLEFARRTGVEMEDTFEFCPEEARPPAKPSDAVEDFFVSLDEALYDN
jgi:hypothetical protein